MFPFWEKQNKIVLNLVLLYCKTRPYYGLTVIFKLLCTVKVEIRKFLEFI